MSHRLRRIVWIIVAVPLALIAVAAGRAVALAAARHLFGSLAVKCGELDGLGNVSIFVEIWKSWMRWQLSPHLPKITDWRFFGCSYGQDLEDYRQARSQRRWGCHRIRSLFISIASGSPA
jgi:hypothetical protein